MENHKPTKRFIPQDSVWLKARHEQLRYLYKTETALANAMVNEMKLHHEQAWIDQSRVNRILNGKEAATALELLVLAKLFQSSFSDLLKVELHSYSGLNESIPPVLKQQNTAEESDNYLTELESEGRILAFNEFPSALFITTDKHPKRTAQMMQASYENIEYYTVDSYLNFLFSMANPFSLESRTAILEQYIQYFGCKQGNTKRRIAFFSRYHYRPLSHFSNLELLKKRSILIIPAPILQENEGEIFLEMYAPSLCKEVEDFYINQIETLRNSLSLLEIGKATLTNRLDGMCMEDSMRWFYQKCQQLMEFSTDADVVWANFSPEAQAVLIPVGLAYCDKQSSP